jgi:hypothetical protein
MLTSLDSLSSIGDALGSAASSAAKTAASVATGGASDLVLGDKLTRGVVIVLGLLLVAAGLFSFEKTREIVVQAGKTAVAAAA